MIHLIAGTSGVTVNTAVKTSSVYVHSVLSGRYMDFAFISCIFQLFKWFVKRTYLYKISFRVCNITGTLSPGFIFRQVRMPRLCRSHPNMPLSTSSKKNQRKSQFCMSVQPFNILIFMVRHLLKISPIEHKSVPSLMRYTFEASSPLWSQTENIPVKWIIAPMSLTMIPNPSSRICIFSPFTFSYSVPTALHT